MNATTETTADIELLPLADLSISPLNARADVPDDEVQAMADSIATSGLLQNLIGLRGADGTVQIVGGGKRLRALQRLAESDTIFDPVPVKVTDDEMQAVAWSGAENTARSALHPADEIRAYARMRNIGRTTPQIARTFSVTETHVARRLKLADLPNDVLNALRTDTITLDAAKALTLAPTPEQASDALADIKGRDVHANTIRARFTRDDVPSTDRRVKFVGIDAYTAAGGTMDTDLFEGHSYLHQEYLLNQLFTDALQAKADEIRRDQGWSWVTVETAPHVDFSKTRGMDRIERTPVNLPTADADELARLEALENDSHGSLDADDATRLAELTTRAEGDYTSADIAAGGVFIYVTHQGRLKISDAYRSRADATATPDTAPDATDDTVTIDRSAAPQTKVMPQNLLNDLRCIKTLSLQQALLDKTELLLDLLAFSLHPKGAQWGQPLAVKITAQPIRPEKSAGTTIDARLDPQPDTPMQFNAETFQAFRDGGKKQRNAILSHALARGVAGHLPELSDVLAHEVKVNVRKVWTPTAAGFFSACRADYLDGIWAQLLELDDDDERRATFAKLNRGQKAKELEKLFSDASVRETHGLSRAQNAAIDAWLPDELKWGATS